MRTGSSRRFSDIGELGGVRIEDPEVCEVLSRKVVELVGEGLVDGLRIDHPDGLANPAQYRHLVAVPLRPGARFEPPGGWRPVVSGLYSR